MGAYTEAIKQLQSEIEQEERSIAEKRAALDTLMRLDARAAGIPYTPPPAHHAYVPARKITLGEATDAIIRSIGDKEFNVADVERELLQRYQIVTVRTRIAMKIKEFVDRGALVRTFEGTGSAPHRYIRREVAGALGKPKEASAHEEARNGA